jgi:hypothetical protein
VVSLELIKVYNLTMSLHFLIYWDHRMVSRCEFISSHWFSYLKNT